MFMLIQVEPLKFRVNIFIWRKPQQIELNREKNKNGKNSNFTAAAADDDRPWGTHYKPY